MLKTLKNKLKKNNKGFTLVELLVVIAITGVLGAVAVPTVFGSTEKANVSAVVADYNAIRTAVLGYSNDEGELPGDFDDLIAGKYLDRTPKSPFNPYYLDATTQNAVKLKIENVPNSAAKLLETKLDGSQDNSAGIVTVTDETVIIEIVEMP
jgi:prepilin-type N-terminal cleavage/methylation domain-containing protein